jgi:hypothetical protein
MSSYMNRGVWFEPRSFDRGAPPLDGTAKTPRSRFAVTDDRAEHIPASSREPTLDDFGGRSDALGG